MATSRTRRPLPALAFLLALSLLTALVWWRVLHRSDSAGASASPSCSATATPSLTVVPAPASVTVTVLNSTQKNGLAGQVTGVLAADGFKTGTATNDETARAPVTGIAEIRYGPTGAAGAKLLSFYVPGAVLVTDGRADASIDLAIGAKFTAVVNATDAAKALAAAKISQAPAAPGSVASSATVPKSTASAPKSSAPKSSSSAKRSASSSVSC